MQLITAELFISKTVLKILQEIFAVEETMEVPQRPLDKPTVG